VLLHTRVLRIKSDLSGQALLQAIKHQATISITRAAAAAPAAACGARDDNQTYCSTRNKQYLLKQ
jgi:hypothetical protein